MINDWWLTMTKHKRRKKEGGYWKYIENIFDDSDGGDLSLIPYFRQIYLIYLSLSSKKYHC